MSSGQVTQNWRQLLSIQAGGVVCLPVIMIGQVLGDKYGWTASLCAIGIGNLILLVLALMAVKMSTLNKKSTVEQAVRYLGGRGAWLFALILMGSMVGWFAIQLNLMSVSLASLLDSAGVFADLKILNGLLGLALAALLLKGIEAVRWLATISLPLLILTLAYAVFSIDFVPKEKELTSLSFWSGLALIISVELVAIIDLPTFFQYAKSPKDGYITIFLLYGCVVPCIEGVGLYLACQTEAKTLIEVLQAGQSFWWSLWVTVFVLLAGWTTNNANLYSAVVNTERLFPRLNFKMRVALLTAAGIGLACCNLLENMEFTLNLLGIAVGSLGAILLSSYGWEEWVGKQLPLSQGVLLAWMGGFMAGLFSLLGIWTGLSMPLLDAFSAALIINILILNSQSRRLASETVN